VGTEDLMAQAALARILSAFAEPAPTSTDET
jgi:hypothetical protein